MNSQTLTYAIASSPLKLDILKLNSHTMSSVWDRPELKEAAYDISNPFISKAVAPGALLMLKLVDILPKVRPDDTKIGKPGDTFFMICCNDESGKERSIDQNGPKGAFMKALREAKIELGDKFLLGRAGEKLDTVWSITKYGADGLPAPQYVPETKF